METNIIQVYINFWNEKSFKKGKHGYRKNLKFENNWGTENITFEEDDLKILLWFQGTSIFLQLLLNIFQYS